MYKHYAESIKETPEKRFISQADKDKYDSYNFITKENSYCKKEIDDMAETLNGSIILSEGEGKVSQLHTKNAYIDSFEIHGGTIQSENDLSNIKHVGDKVGENEYSICVKTIGKNLFNIDEYYNRIRHISGVSRTDRGFKTDCDVNATVGNDLKLIPLIDGRVIKPNTRYVIRCKTTHVGDLNMGIVFKYTDGTFDTFTPKELHYVYSEKNKEVENVILSWVTQYNGGHTVLEDIAVYEVEENTGYPQEYVPYQESTSEIVFKEPLRKVDNTSDVMIVEDGNVKCIRKIGTLKLYEDFKFYGENYNNEPMDNVVKFCVMVKENAPLVSDYPKYKAFSNFVPFVDCNIGGDYEHVFMERHDDKQYAVIYISLDKVNKYEGTMAVKIKSYLRDQKAEVYYEMVDEQLYGKDESMTVKSFEGCTLFMLDNEVQSGKVKCSMPIHIGQSIHTSNNKVKVLENKISEIKNNVSENGLKKEVIIGDTFETDTGYLQDFEIKGRTKFDLSSKLTDSVYSFHSSILQQSTFTFVSGARSCSISSTQQVAIVNGAWGYIIFKGLTPSDLKPNTRYLISFNLNSIYNYRPPYVGLLRHDSKVVNAPVVSPVDKKQGRLQYIIKTNSEILDGACTVFISLDGSNFVAGEKVVIDDLSIIELTDEETLPIIEHGISGEYPLVSVGKDGIEIINQSPNLFSFAKVLELKNTDDAIRSFSGPERLKITFNGVDDISVENVLTTNVANDSYFIMAPKYNPIGELIPGMEYELSWKAEVVKEGLGNPVAQGGSMIYFINTLSKVEYTYRPAAMNSTPILNNKLVFKYTGSDISDFLFRINVNTPGAKIRFYDIRLVPRYSEIADKEYEFNNVKIDLTKYGIQDGLKSLPDGTCDRIFKRNGKYYLEQNILPITLDHTRKYNLLDISENHRVRMWTNTQTLFARWSSSINSKNMISTTTTGTTNGGYPNETGSNILTNNFIGIDHNGNTVIGLSYDKVKTEAEFVEYLRQNPITLYAEMLHPRIVELEEDLDMVAYQGANTLRVKNQGISPEVKFVLPGNINNTIDVLTDKIRKLQTNNVMLDMLMLRSTYNGDKSRLDLSLMMGARGIFETDKDLYELIIKVINSKACKQEELENMIDFFFMVDKLSMEMVDVLFILLEEVYKK